VTILRIHGPFLFGTTDLLAEETEDLKQFRAIVILRLRNMTAIDATGLHAMNVFANRIRKSGRSLLVCGARRQPATLIDKSEFARNIGRNNILPHVQAALTRAREIYSSPHPATQRQ